MHELTVCKFGGSSLADAQCFRQVSGIIRADARRKYIVVSAPGRSPGEGGKITDMLIAAHNQPEKRGMILDNVRNKFRQIASGLGVPSPEQALSQLEEYAVAGHDSIASRGEHICAKLLADYMHMPYIEAGDIFRFCGGALDISSTYDNIRRMEPCGVIPGFYGADEQGNIVTFPRGGSDISAAHIAAALGAESYENWTDVDGFFTADPALVSGARHIPHMDYWQAQLYSYLGAGVLHYDSITPVACANIPVIVRNTFAPNAEGTLICAESRCDMPCIAVRSLQNGRHLVSAMNLSPAMQLAARAVLGGGVEHCGTVCAECEPAQLHRLMEKLHGKLMGMQPQN